jgi:hypothetical protein
MHVNEERKLVGQVLINVSVLSDARCQQGVTAGEMFCARSIKPFEGGRPGLRQTWALWKFKGGKERRADVSRLSCEARQQSGCA